MDIDRLKQLSGLNELGYDSPPGRGKPMGVEEINAKVEAAKDKAMDLARDLEALAPHLGLDDAEVREMSDWLAGLAGDLDSI